MSFPNTTGAPRDQAVVAGSRCVAGQPRERPLPPPPSPAPEPAARPRRMPGSPEPPRPDSGQRVCQWAPGPARWGSWCLSDRRETAPRQPGGQPPALRSPPSKCRSPLSSRPLRLLTSRGPLQPGRWRADMPPGCTHRAASPRGGPFPGPRRRGPRSRGAGSGRGGGAGWAGGPTGSAGGGERGGENPRAQPPKCTRVQRPQLRRGLWPAGEWDLSRDPLYGPRLGEG